MCVLSCPRYPALQWQTRAARRALSRALEAGVVLSERVALARYAGVPLAHLAGEGCKGRGVHGTGRACGGRRDTP